MTKLRHTVRAIDSLLGWGGDGYPPPGGLPSQTEFSIACALKLDGTLERLMQRVGIQGVTLPTASLPAILLAEMFGS
jgi:hypothetical protein